MLNVFVQVVTVKPGDNVRDELANSGVKAESKVGWIDSNGLPIRNGVKVHFANAVYCLGNKLLAKVAIK